jgi:hypothetical protein
MTVIASLHAGVGNRFFEYASLKGLARRQGSDFAIGYWEPHSGHASNHRWFLTKVTEPMVQSHAFVDQPVKEHVGVPTPGNVPENVCLRGFYQHEDNFHHIADELRQQFSESPEIAKELDQIVRPTDWAIHFRLGDYILNGKHFVNLTKYYLECLKRVPVNDGARLLVVCEDPHNIQRVYPEVFAELERMGAVSPPKSHEELDMYLMSRCEGVICSNSTFAWWGAWLGRPKRVFLPDRFFADQNDTRMVPMRGAEIIPVLH